MNALLRSHFSSAVLGGVVVATAFLLLGVTGQRTKETIVEQSPVDVQPSSSESLALTPHEIYVRDAPGVVFVRAQVIEQVQDPFDLFPQQQSSVSTGSGFLIDREGHILTNFHVIEGASHTTGVTVQFEDDISRTAVVVGEDPNNDLALLKVDTSGLPTVQPLALGDSTGVHVGDPTLAIGNPFGLDRTLTSGIVSALQRQIRAPNGFAIDNVIQADAPINPGNSGGPLLDALGRVIGINSQIATGDDGNGSVGIAFAVPINTAAQLLPRLEGGGTVRLGYLGVSGVAAPGSRGVVVQRADAGGPAANAGLRKGDVIKTIAGRPATSMGDVQAIVEARLPGQAIVIAVRRATRMRRLTVVLGSRTAHTPSG
jgi:S1-C subfamily serine protease